MFRSFVSRVFFSTRCYYEVLHISPKASQEEVKNAYFKLSKLNPQDNCLTEAYEVLSKPSLRDKYDRGMLTVRNGIVTEYDHSVWDDAVFRQKPLKMAGRGEQEDEKIRVQEYEKFGVQWLIISLSVLFVLLVKIIDNKKEPESKIDEIKKLVKK